MGGRKIKDIISVRDYLLSRKIAITAEYLPGMMNLETNRESRNLKDTGEWKMCTEALKNICQARGTPDIDLFVSRISHQFLQYLSWKLNPFSRGQDAVQINWSQTSSFPLIALIGRALRKVQQYQALVIIITPAWQTQAWISVKNSLQLPQKQGLLKNLEGKNHLLIQENSLRLMAWTI